MAIGDTRRLLKNFRRRGYFVTAVRDNTGRLAWDIFYPNIRHDYNTNLNEVTPIYLGQVERYGNPNIGNWSPLGRPFFYVTHLVQTRNQPYTQDAITTVRQTPRTTVRNQL